GLGGGLPIGATITVGAENTGLLSAGQHGTTFGGNPIACAAALAVLTTIETEGLIDHARRLGEQLKFELADIPGIAEVTGQGLLLGLGLAGENPDAKAVAKRALEAGFIVNPVTPERLRLAPPLSITHEEIAPFLAALPDLLTTID
ncbi:acetylornithine transaminase, partial [Burkholderia multivorans]